MKNASLKVLPDVYERWREAASPGSFQSWAVRVLNEAADAELAGRRDVEHLRAERLKLRVAVTPQREYPHFKPDFKR